jgi:segregation and condensation protein B
MTMNMEDEEKIPAPDAAPEGATSPSEPVAPAELEPAGSPSGTEPSPEGVPPGEAAAAPAPAEGGDAPESAPAPEAAAPSAEPEKPSPRTPQDLKRIIEALLFSCDAPLTPAKIRDAIPRISAQAIRDAIDLLKAEYAQAGRAFELVEIAEGFQILTRPEYDDWIARLKKARAQAKLSAAALETLAIIAYKQPIRRVDIEAIRGVQSGELVRALMERGLIKITGRADQPGAPLLYGTTKDFLDAVGLQSLAELPKPEEVK